MTITKKLKRSVAVARDQGIKALCSAIKGELSLVLSQSRCENRLLRRILHPKLREVELELTNDCNLNCKMCTFRIEPREIGYISWPLFVKVVDQLSEIGVNVLRLQFGGESLLHPKFKDCLRYAIHKRDVGKIKKVSWTENGMLFNQTIADLVVDLKVDSISFSIDGIREVNDSIRLGSKYSVIERNIKYLIKRRGKAQKPEISLSVTGYGKSKEQEMDIYREWISIVDKILVAPCMTVGGTVDSSAPFFGGHRSKNPPSLCWQPFEKMVISWDGRVTSCCADGSFKLNLGDATQESLKEIWCGSRYQDLRRAVLAKTFPAGSICSTCEYWKTTFEGETELFLDGVATAYYTRHRQWKEIRRSCALSAE